MNEEVLNNDIKSNSEKIIGLLKELKKTSSWEIKIKLGLTSSMLYMALGHLIAEKKISVYLKDLIYIVELSENPEIQ
ncbi:MAG TPA: winged helix-turn-helix domain-containing protein [Elusimicrobiales bacterium]|jgi:hypothetical protein|nr:winged helix-turn-helix domain-containing protein [Elusimicrobiales bacterium]HOL62883.1 winged helix-turn-helix domain-containing protein [Elusimicrobiales bacterium]HPO94997.1 winged helix-turn-helix domain-containing protein [Elusimicrobiales bacterium]